MKKGRVGARGQKIRGDEERGGKTRRAKVGLRKNRKETKRKEK